MVKKQKPSINERLKFFAIEPKDDNYLLLWYHKYRNFVEFPKKMIKFVSFDPKDKETDESKLDSIRKNLVYLENPQNYNDPFDGKFYAKITNSNNIKYREIVISYPERHRELEKKYNVIDPDIYGVFDKKEENEEINNAFKQIKEEYNNALQQLTKQKQIEEEFIKVQDEKKYRVCSFQRYEDKYININPILTKPQMWSYYANWHKGICIEYDTSNILKYFSDSFDYESSFNSDRVLKENDLDYACRLFKILYRRKMPFVNIDKYNKKKNKDVYIEQIILRSIITKSKEWKQEDEYRLIVNINDKKIIKKENAGITNYFFKGPTIQKIYLGVNLDKKIENKIIKIANERNISLEKLIIKKDCYELDIDCNNKRINELKNNLMLKEVFDKFKPNNAL